MTTGSVVLMCGPFPNPSRNGEGDRDASASWWRGRNGGGASTPPPGFAWSPSPFRGGSHAAHISLAANLFKSPASIRARDNREMTMSELGLDFELGEMADAIRDT